MLVSGLAANAGTEFCTLDFVAGCWSPRRCHQLARPIPAGNRGAATGKPGLKAAGRSQILWPYAHLESRKSFGFRTIQDCPKDLEALPRHPEPAVTWHSGFREGAHARPKATRVHHAARRRSSVAACGAFRCPALL